MMYGDCEGFVNGKQYKSSRIDDDYSYYNDYEVMKAGRRRQGRRQNAAGRRRVATAAAHSVNAHTTSLALLLSAASALRLISTVPSIRLGEGRIRA